MQDHSTPVIPQPTPEEPMTDEQCIAFWRDRASRWLQDGPTDAEDAWLMRVCASVHAASVWRELKNTTHADQ